MSSAAFGANIAFIEELYEKYRTDPTSVSSSWREFFADYEPQLGEEEEDVEERVAAVAGGAAFAPQTAVATAAPAPKPAAPSAPAPPRWSSSVSWMQLPPA